MSQGFRDFMPPEVARAIRTSRETERRNTDQTNEDRYIIIANAASRLAKLLKQQAVLPKVFIYHERHPLSKKVGDKLPPSRTGWPISFESIPTRDSASVGWLTVLTVKGTLAVCRARFDADPIEELGIFQPETSSRSIEVATVGAGEQIYEGRHLTHDRLMEAAPQNGGLPPSYLDVTTALGLVAGTHRIDL